MPIMPAPFALRASPRSVVYPGIYRGDWSKPDIDRPQMRLWPLRCGVEMITGAPTAGIPRQSPLVLGVDVWGWQLGTEPRCRGFSVSG